MADVDSTFSVQEVVPYPPVTADLSHLDDWKPRTRPDFWVIFRHVVLALFAVVIIFPIAWVKEAAVLIFTKESGVKTLAEAKGRKVASTVASASGLCA